MRKGLSNQQVVTITIVVLAFIFVLSAITCVKETDRGIMYTLGAAKASSADDIVQPGFHLRIPFGQSIKKWSIKPRSYDVEIDIANRGAISKDNQIIGMSGKVVWAFDPVKIHIIAREYPSTDDLIEIIKNTCYAASKEVIGKYTIFDLAANQATIQNAINENLVTQLGRYPIKVTQFNLTNFDWSKDFDQQIQATMNAAQQVRQAEQQANISEQQNRKQLIEAEAAAAASIAKAEGELKTAQIKAEAAKAEAEGIAEANRIKAAPTAMEYQRLLWDYEVKMERAKHLAPGVEVPQYIPLAPNGSAAVITGNGR